jgi:hypothetical protein
MYQKIWDGRNYHGITDLTAETWPWIPFDEKLEITFQNFSVINNCREGELYEPTNNEEMQRMEKMLRLASFHPSMVI